LAAGGEGSSASADELGFRPLPGKMQIVNKKFLLFLNARVNVASNKVLDQ
jgi:hypothetical protein